MRNNAWTIGWLLVCTGGVLLSLGYLWAGVGISILGACWAVLLDVEAMDIGLDADMDAVTVSDEETDHGL